MKALRKQKIETANIQVGDQMVIPLAELGEFTATAHKVTDEGVMFIFDEYVTCRPMNNCSTNKGGFEKSDLKKWMDTVLFMAFPEELRDKIYGLTIPTVGQIVGHEDEWDNKNLEPDSDEQLPLMKECKNRIACFEDQLTWGWLRNATKEGFSSAYFADVYYHGNTLSGGASTSYGVRPEFWLVKPESRGPVPRRSGRYPWDFDAGSEDILHYCQNDVMITKEAALKMEIWNKENEIDTLRKEIEKLEKYKQYDKATAETKVIMDSFVRAGFTENQASANGALIFNETPLVSGTAITHTAGSPDVQINQPGIYQAFFTGTVLIDAGTTIPSTLTVQLTLNGVPITGAVARHTFTASNEEVTLSMNAPFPVTGAGTLEVVTSDAGYTFEDASLTVVRLGDSTNFRTAV